MDTAQASREVESLKESVASNNLQQATRTLQSLKKHIASNRSLPPFLEHSPTQQQEVSLARPLPLLPRASSCQPFPGLLLL
jgi:hypothetical protein